MTTLRQQAVEYAELNYYVLPLRQRDKTPYTKFAKQGHWSATNDPKVIDAWWQQNPLLNIGIFCERSEVIVLDVDFNRLGEEAWDFYENKLPDTYGVATGHGAHFYYRCSRGMWFPKELCPGIDIKYRGYVVAPPSIHPNGLKYMPNAVPLSNMEHVPDFVLELGDIDVATL